MTLYSDVLHHFTVWTVAHPVDTGSATVETVEYTSGGSVEVPADLDALGAAQWWIDVADLAAAAATMDATLAITASDRRRGITAFPYAVLRLSDGSLLSAAGHDTAVAFVAADCMLTEGAPDTFSAAVTISSGSYLTPVQVAEDWPSLAAINPAALTPIGLAIGAAPAAATYASAFWTRLNTTVETEYGESGDGSVAFTPPVLVAPEPPPPVGGAYTAAFTAADIDGFAGTPGAELLLDGEPSGWLLYLDWSAEQGAYVAILEPTGELVTAVAFVEIQIDGDLGPVSITPDDPEDPVYGIAPLPGGQSIIVGNSYALTLEVTVPA